MFARHAVQSALDVCQGITRQLAAVLIFDLNGHCSGKRAGQASFREISAGYFKHEARHSFVTEAAFFAAIVITSAVPLISGAHAMLNLIRSIGGL
jgi:hypothetical protein